MRLEERHVERCLMKNCDFGVEIAVLESVMNMFCIDQCHMGKCHCALNKTLTSLLKP